MAAQSMPVVETAFYGWKIWVQGEHVRVTRPDGSLSEWHERPATNGSGLYDLCLVVARETPGAAAWIGTPKEGGKPCVTLEPDTRDDWEARYGRTIEPLYRHAPRRTGWWYSDVWQPLTLDDAIDQMSDMREDWAEMGCRLGFDSYTDVEVMLGRADELSIAAAGPAYTPQQMAASFRAGQNTEHMQQDEQQGVSLPPLPVPAHESVSECGPDYFDASQMREYAQAALAATGKQQVGEVQGDAREQFEASYRNLDLTRDGQGYSASDTNYTWNVWQAALAARQPADYHGDVDLKWLSGSIGEVAHRLRTYMPHLAEWTDRARDCGIAAKVLEDLAARQPGAQGPVAGPYLDEPDAPSNPLWKRLRSIANWLTVLAPDCHMEAAELLLAASARIQRNDAAPPAQGIDLELMRDLIDYAESGKVAEPSMVERMRAMIDQRDAAPGVGNG